MFYVVICNLLLMQNSHLQFVFKNLSINLYVYYIEIFVNIFYLIHELVYYVNYILMKYNASNFHPIKQFFDSYQITTDQEFQYLQFASKAIYQEPLPTIFFALIQNLFLNSEKQKLETITEVVEKQLEKCSDHQDIYSSGNSLMNVLEEMSSALDKEKDIIEQILKKKLYKSRDAYLPFLRWLFSTSTIEKLLETFSKQFDKDFIIYLIKDKRFRQGPKIFQNNQQNSQDELQNHGIIKRIHLFFSQQNNHILYQYQIYQIDNILNVSNINYRIINKLKKDIEISQEKLKVTISSKDKIIQKLTSQKNKQIQTLKNAKNVQKSNFQTQIKKINQEHNKILNKKQQQYEQIKRKKLELEQQLKKQKQRSKKIKSKMDESNSNKKEMEHQYELLQQKLQNQILKYKKKNQQLTRENLQLKNQITKLDKQQTLNSPKQLKISDEIRFNKNFVSLYQNQPRNKSIKIKKNNFNSFIIKSSSDFSKKQCVICNNYQIPYQIYNCQSHFYCKKCHIQHIRTSVQDGKIPFCPTQNCGKEFNSATLCNMLKQQKLQAMFEKISVRILKNQKKDVLFQCPYCKQIFQKPNNLKVINHCNRNTCTICSEEHSSTQSCSQSNLIKVLPLMERPYVCPTCLTLYSKDDNCEHVTCLPCQQRKLQPQGICAICCVVRHPIISHDNSYHRPSCKFYNEVKNQVPQLKNNCSECVKNKVACKPPTQTLTQFLQKHFSANFIKKLMQKRTQYKMDEKK